MNTNKQKKQKNAYQKEGNADIDTDAILENNVLASISQKIEILIVFFYNNII